MLKTGQLFALASFAALAGGGTTAAYADEFFQYFQRKDTVTLSAGNAKAVNAVTQMIDPWPRYVGNRRTPANGERMAGAVLRYRDVGRIGRTPPPMSHPSGGGGGAATTGGGGGIAPAGGGMAASTGY
jgi:hypothetical protein